MSICLKVQLEGINTVTIVLQARRSGGGNFEESLVNMGILYIADKIGGTKFGKRGKGCFGKFLAFHKIRQISPLYIIIPLCSSTCMQYSLIWRHHW